MKTFRSTASNLIIFVNRCFYNKVIAQVSDLLWSFISVHWSGKNL